MLTISNARLKATGFALPTGIPKAIREAVSLPSGFCAVQD
jgi:hypothetical protein